MSIRCKQGQQAIIINALVTANIGREVTVAEAIGRVERGGTFEYNGSHYTAPISDHFWWIVAKDPLQTPFEGITTNKVYIPDSWLMPIEDPEDPNAIDTAEPTIHSKELDTVE